MPRPPVREHVEGRRVSSLLLAVLTTILVAPLLLLLTSSPSAAEGETAEPCFASSTDDFGCLAGTIRSEADTVEGVDLVITAPDGTESTATTDANGKWTFKVLESGDWVVAIDEESLPDGIGAVGQTERTIKVNLDGKQRNFTAIFEVRTGDYDASTSRSDLFIQSIFNGLRLGLLLAMASVGLSLIYGTTGLSNFAHAEQVTLGGIVAYALINVGGMNLWLGMVLTVLLCASTGYLQDRGIWQPLRRRGLGLTQMMIVTIGMSLAAQYAFQYAIGASTVKVVVGSFNTYSFGPITVTSMTFVAMGVSIAMIAAVGYVLLRTRIGRATRAVSDNPALAAASGIDVDRIIRLVWTASAGLAGLSGIFYALVVSNGIRWDTGMQILLLLFAAVTLGGLGTAFGALVGSLVIGMVVELANPLGAPGDLKYAVALAILILLLLVRPQGLLGRAERVG